MALLLPQLSSPHNVPGSEQQGEWREQNQSIFANIADAIDTSDVTTPTSISSVPDVWARPLTFQSALRQGSNHPLRKRCIQEWRGLISLLALRDYMGYKVDIIPVIFEQNHPFSNALRTLASRSIQLEASQAYSWSDTLIIRYEDIPVGALCPATLVYTGVDYNTRLNAIHTNLKDNDGYLTPPDNPNELRKIGEWLQAFQTEFNSLVPLDNNSDQQIIDGINSLINDWLSEIRNKLNLQLSESLDDPNVKIAAEYSGSALNSIVNYRIYQALLKPLLKERPPTVISDVLLTMSESIKNYNAFNNVIVISEGLLTDPQMRIYDNLQLTHLGGNAKTCIASFFQEASGQKIGTKADLTANNDIWIRPEKYFLTDILLKGQDGSLLTENEMAFNGENGYGKYILPFRKEILSFFSPEDIIKICRPSYSAPDGGNTIIFSFYLPVMGRPDVKFERAYKGSGAVVAPGEGFIQEIQAPVVDIFPNYLDANWRQYYMFQSNLDQYSVNPVTPVPVKGVDGNLPPVAPKVTTKEFQDTSVKYKQKVRITEIKGDNAFPEAVEFMAASGETLGMVLMQKPSQEPADLSGQWTVGVDFGTSNTTVYIHDGQNANVMNMNLAQHFRRVTRCREDEEKYLLHNYFVPCSEINHPFPTTLRVYNEAFQEKMLLDYAIYIPLDTEYNLPANVYGDIKWDGTTDKTKGFLTNLVFLILVDAIAARKKTLRFEYSFPKSFTDSHKNSIIGIWAEILDKLIVKDSVSLSFRTAIGQGTPATWPNNNDEVIDEGLATGRYFGSEDTNKSGTHAKVVIGAVCLDVGGGTTDISVWHNNGIVMDASVLMAGRELSELFRSKPALRHTLFPEPACIALEEKVTDSRQFGTRLNVILKREEDYLKRKLVGSLNDSNIELLKQLIALEFGGFTYFSALMTIAANEQSGGSLREIIDEYGIGVYWGGNGARFLNWLDNGSYNSEGIAFKVLANIYGNALKRFNIPIKLSSYQHVQSTAPKHEVAGGIVIDRTLGRVTTIDNAATGDGLIDIDSQSHVGLFISGVELTLRDGRVIKPTERIAESDIYDDRQLLVKSIQYDNIKHCVDILNAVAIQLGIYKQGQKIDFEKNRAQVATNVLSDLTRQAIKGPGNRTIEPIFIMGMRELFKILSS